MAAVSTKAWTFSIEASVGLEPPLVSEWAFWRFGRLPIGYYKKSPRPRLSPIRGGPGLHDTPEAHLGLHDTPEAQFMLHDTHEAQFGLHDTHEV